MSASYYFQVTLTFIGLGILLFFILRLSNHLQKKKYTGDIQVLDRKVINTALSLLIVSVKEKSYLLSVSGKSATVLDKL